MVKKLFLIGALLSALTGTALAVNTSHHFDSSALDSTQPCTSGDPCNNFNASGLDVSGLACGDHIKLLRGKEWAGGEAWIKALLASSSSCSANPVYVEAYGSAGAKPVLNGEYVTTGFSTASGSGSSTIYSKTGQTQTHLKTVGWKVSGERGAMGYWSGATNTLPDNSFKRSGSTLYINPPASSNPETSEIRIGNFAHGDSADGGHGLLEGGEDVTTSSNIRFRDIAIHAPNGVGVSLNGTGIRTMNLTITGAGQDGWLCWHLGFAGSCSDFWDYYSKVSYSAAGANGGGGSGQGITSWGGPQGGFTGTYAFRNYMASLDLLDFSGATNVTEVWLHRTRLILGGGAVSNPSYDPGAFYSDGASEVGGYGNIFGPRWGNYLNNASVSFKIGSEHPTSKPSQNHWFSNSLLYSPDWTLFLTDNICYGSTSECPPSGDSTPPQNILNTSFNFATILDWGTAGDNSIFDLEEISSTASNLEFMGNVYVIKQYLAYYNFPTGSSYNGNFNIYYVRGQASSSTNMIRLGGSARNLSYFISNTGEGTGSSYGNPLFTNDSVTTPDVTVGDGSPVIDACGSVSPRAIPSWVPQTIKDDIGPSPYVRGSTRPSGVEDSGSTDCGFHYDYARLTSATVSTTASTTDTNVSATVTFTIPDKVTALILDDSIRFTVPSGWVLNSGGTSVATSSDISGTWSACTVTGSNTIITCPRVGDGNSEFPGTYHFTVSNIRTQTLAGTSGTFALEFIMASGDPITGLTKRAEAMTIPGVNITSGAPAVCGNSAIESGESCDDGNTTALDGCSATCQTETPVCGNSLVEYLEQCDDGNTDALDGCSDTCQIESPVCGNGVIESGEQCDDGNTTASDGCDATCQTESVVPGAHFSCRGPFVRRGIAVIR